MRCILIWCLWTLAVSAQPELDSEEALALRRIAEFWEEGEYKIAKSQIEDFLAEFPDNPHGDSLCAALGDLFVREKNYQVALNYYSKIENPSLAETVLLNRMECLHQLQWYATLADECEAYLQRSDRCLEAVQFLAIALYWQGIGSEQNQRALAERMRPYFKSVPNEKLSGAAAEALSHLHCILDEPEAASQIYLDLAEKMGGAEEFLFQAALIQAKYDKEIGKNLFQKIADQKGPLAREAAYNHLVLSFEQGAYAQIAEAKESICASMPEGRVFLAHLFIGQSLLALEQKPEATTHLNAFLDAPVDPQSIRPALLHLLEASHRSGDLVLLDKIIDRFKQCTPTNDELAKALLYRAQLLNRAKQLEEARGGLQTLLTQFPQFADRPSACLERVYLESGAANWAACRTSAEFFLQEYPSHELTPIAWRHFASASMELGDLPQCIADLERLLQTGQGIADAERAEFQFHLARIHFELGHIEVCTQVLEPLLAEERGNAELLFALCVRDNGELFCKWAERALSHNATLLPVKEQHLALFNAYIGRSIKQAEEHLYAAFQCGANIQLPNLLWLAERLYRQGPKEVALHLISHLIQEGEPLYLEPLLLKAAVLHNELGRGEESLRLLHALNDQYKSSPELPWACEKEAKLYLAESLLQAYGPEAAEPLFDELSASPLMQDRFTASAALQGAKLKRQSTLPDYTSISSKLKNLVLQKQLENEPIHLEAALEYIDLRTELAVPSERAAKRRHLLAKTKASFEAQEDLLSKDYHIARTKLEAQNQVYLAYMNYFDAQMLLAQAEEHADSEQQKELQAKAKEILLQIEKEGPTELRARLKRY